MNKTDFFKQFHQKLAIKYSIPVSSIEYIRSNAIHHKKTRNQILLNNVKKIHFSTSTKEMRQNVINILASCSNSDYLEITKLTKYDRRSEK